MRVLLDTHVLLWWLAESARLSKKAAGVLADEQCECLWSAAGTWEMAIKLAIGKVRLPEPLSAVIERSLRELLLVPLAIDHRHAVRVADLPPLHRDPFDRMLVAQAQIERVPIVTADPKIGAYGVDVVW